MGWTQRKLSCIAFTEIRGAEKFFILPAEVMMTMCRRINVSPTEICINCILNSFSCTSCRWLQTAGLLSRKEGRNSTTSISTMWGLRLRMVMCGVCYLLLVCFKMRSHFTFSPLYFCAQRKWVCEFVKCTDSTAFREKFYGVSDVHTRIRGTTNTCTRRCIWNGGEREREFLINLQSNPQWHSLVLELFHPISVSKKQKNFYNFAVKIKITIHLAIAILCSYQLQLQREMLFILIKLRF